MKKYTEKIIPSQSTSSRPYLNWIKRMLFDLSIENNWNSKKLHSILEQFILNLKNSKSIFYWLYLPAGLLLLFISIVSHSLDIPFSFFSRDPLAIAEIHPFNGFLSNIGAILWSFSLSVCLFSYAMVKSSKNARVSPGFILFGGVLSLLMLSDDLFMLHERIYPDLFGISEKITFSIYGLLFLIYTIKFRQKILASEYHFLLLTGFFLALSILFDLLQDSQNKWHFLFEDGAKLLGIVSWFAYQFRVCFNEIKLICNQK
jgi:hypothetical protein